MRKLRFVSVPLAVVLLVAFVAGCGNVTLKEAVDSVPVTYDERCWNY